MRLSRESIDEPETALRPSHHDDPKAEPCGAFDPAIFAACMAGFSPFEANPFLAVAVSGGADSLALTLLADRWSRERGGRVVGLTVDHGLRAGSLEEADMTGRWLAARKIEHRILSWTGDKPTSGLQHRAREARYALLNDWCRQHHCFHLLTAHHHQDQAETVAIRKARQSGDAGLAAMPAVREVNGLRLLRPLLGTDKGSLEDHLRTLFQPWIDDPTNDSPSFTRNRLRQEGLDIQALADEAKRQGLKRQAADRRAAAALVQHVTIDPAGFATLDVQGFKGMPTDLAKDVLTRVLLTVGGNAYPPRSQALMRLMSSMRVNGPLGMDPASSGTLAKCRIVRHRDRWLICREYRAKPPESLCPDRPLHWDRRFMVTLRKSGPEFLIGALGKRADIGDNDLIRKGKKRFLPGIVKASLPVVWRDGALAAIPHLGLYSTSISPEDIELRFCPHSPLAKAPFKPHISP